MNPDVDILQVMRESAARMLGFAAGHTRESFEQSPLILPATLWQIVVMGEGVKRLSPEVRSRHPDVPWSQIARTRDRVVHWFDEVKVEVVWTIVQDHAPGLVAALDLILAAEAGT